MEISPHVIAKRYLREGVPQELSAPDVIQSVEALIRDESQVSHRRALKWAILYVGRAKGKPVEVRLSALRALGRTAHFAGKHKQALRAFLAARLLAGRDVITVARIDRVLTDIYMYLGRMTDAQHAAHRSIRTFVRRQMPADCAQSRVNLANVLHRQDKHREAERLYHDAARYFEGTDNTVALARCYYNRANTLVQLFDLEAGESLYERARILWEQAGCHLDACDARYGLAWARLLRGQFHQALLLLTDCERIYREAGDPRGVALCNLDRAEVYVGLGMFVDALSSAQSADHAFSTLGLRYERAKAKLFLGIAATALRQTKRARAALMSARRLFGQEGNHGFLAIASYYGVEISARGPSERREAVAAQRLLRKNQLPYWEAVYHVRSSFSDQDPTGHLKQLRRNAAARRVPFLYALWQTKEGDVAYANGKLAQARRHWVSAADRIDSVRAQLPPVELRSSFGQHAILPHQRMLNLELQADPMHAAIWAERIRTAGLWTPLVQQDSSRTEERDHVQYILGELATEVSFLSRNLSVGQQTRQSSMSASRRLRTLQRQFRTKLLELERDAGWHETESADIERAIQQASRKTTLVQWSYDGPDVAAIIHHDGRTSCLRFVNGVGKLNRAMAEWRFLLERALCHPEQNSAARSSERRYWTQLGEWLWKPLDIPKNEGRVLIIPEGELANLPWGALMVDGEALGEIHTLLTSPSVRHYVAAQAKRAPGELARLYCSRAQDLPFAQMEAESIARLLPTAPIMYSPARREDWPVQASDFLWHFSGHAEIRTDNPFYSYIQMSDGPLFAADFRLRQCQVNLVTLAACQSGEQTTVPGDEGSGLVRGLLEMGARNVVASYWPVADEAAMYWMKAFYSSIATSSDIVTACRQAALFTREKFPSACHWAAFHVSGAGELGGNHV